MYYQLNYEMKKVLLLLTLTITTIAIGQSNNVALNGFTSSVDYKSEFSSDDVEIQESSNHNSIIIKTKDRMFQAKLYMLDAKGYVVKRYNSLSGFNFEIKTDSLELGEYTIRLINGADKFDQKWIKK